VTFQKGRQKTGGRIKGGVTRVQADLRERIAALFPDYCPIESMAAIAQDGTQELTLRLSAHKEVAQYLYPKRKAIELSGSVATTTLSQILLSRRKGRDSEG